MGLFKPAWQSADTQKALHAVEKETNQRKLVKIAEHSRNALICKAVIDRITDLKLLFAAIKRFDIIMYLDGYKNARDYLSYARDCLENRQKELVQSLNDQSMLLKYAGREYSKTVRGTAIERLTDQSVLNEMFDSESNDLFYRCCAFAGLYAMGKLSDFEVDSYIYKMISYVKEYDKLGLRGECLEVLLKLFDVLTPEGCIKFGYERSSRTASNLSGDEAGYGGLAYGSRCLIDILYKGERIYSYEKTKFPDLPKGNSQRSVEHGTV